MIYYKGSYNLCGQNINFEIGKTYSIIGDLKTNICDLDFCKNPDDLFLSFQFNKDFVLMEVDVLGKVIDFGPNSYTDKMKIIRVVPNTECNKIFKNLTFDGKHYHFKNYFFYKLLDNENKNDYSVLDKNLNVIYTENKQGKKEGFQEWIKYNKNGKIINYKNSDGFHYTQKFDKDGRITRYRDSNKKALFYEYDDCGNLIYSTSYDKNDGFFSSHQTYNKDNKLTYYIDNVFEEHIYEYNENNFLVHFVKYSGKDVNKNKIRECFYEYNERLDETRYVEINGDTLLNEGYHVSYSYNDDGSSENHYIYSNGEEEWQSLDSRGNVLSYKKKDMLWGDIHYEYRYDNNDNIIWCKTGDNEEEIYLYDSKNNLVFFNAMGIKYELIID